MANSTTQSDYWRLQENYRRLLQIIGNYSAHVSTLSSGLTHIGVGACKRGLWEAAELRDDVLHAREKTR